MTLRIDCHAYLPPPERMAKLIRWPLDVEQRNSAFLTRRAPPVAWHGIVRAMITGMSRWFAWARDPEQLGRIALLDKTPVFAGLPRRLLGRLATALFEKEYAAGDVVFHQGDPGKGLFIVLEGSVAISRSTPDGDLPLATLGPGEAFGELALIDDLPRSATARVTVPSRLLILYRSHLDALVEGNRDVALVVMRNLLRRLALYVRRAAAPVPSRAERVESPPSTGGGPGVPGAPGIL